MMAEDGARVAKPQTTTRPVIKLKARIVAVGRGVGAAVPTEPVERLDLDLEGITGDRHAGFVRPADSRVPWYRRGEPIHNERQLSIVSVEELAAVSERLQLPDIRAEWLGANVVVEGIPHLSLVPRGTRLFCASGAVLAVTDQNAPCRLAGASLAKAVGAGTDLALRFVDAAKRARGVVAYVDRAGAVVAGDTVDVRIPEQWLWER
jgi:hypothetical protein